MRSTYDFVCFLFLFVKSVKNYMLWLQACVASPVLYFLPIFAKVRRRLGRQSVDFASRCTQVNKHVQSSNADFGGLGGKSTASE